ncbi:hypothetical protein GGF40_003762 [Coemansia sp. RSA 1286]|nr:hypothetical protein GGF40_003762 [Coemansia sp. RSA 1286]
MDSTSESTLASANAPVDRDTIYFRNRDYGSECHTRISSKGGRFLSRCQVFIKRMQVAGSASKHNDKIDAARDNNIQWPVSVEQRLTEQRLLANNALHMRPLLQPSVATAILMRNSDCKSMSFNLWTPVSADGWVKQQTSKDLDL